VDPDFRNSEWHLPEGEQHCAQQVKEPHGANKALSPTSASKQ